VRGCWGKGKYGVGRENFVNRKNENIKSSGNQMDKLDFMYIFHSHRWASPHLFLNQYTNLKDSETGKFQ